jgi:hypothetical protein
VQATRPVLASDPDLDGAGEVLEGVVRKVGLEHRTDCETRGLQQRVAIRRSLRYGGGADIAAGTGTVLDDHLLPEALAERLGGRLPSDDDLL